MHKKSPLLKLTPFLDTNGILRLTGRIEKSGLPYDTIHPIVLSPKCQISKLLAHLAHKTTLHGGTQMCQQYLRNKYWILASRNLIKGEILNCITCIRQRKQDESQLMAQLPIQRVDVRKPSRAFQYTNLDYAGPVLIKRQGGRSRVIDKGYIAVFVCTKTKAVHLELVSDLTTDAFIAAFSRFVNRRGKVHELMSDNATTFHGAANEMKAIFKTWQNSVNTDWIKTNVMNWTFIPPAAPHMGGLHEAAVKSAKYHLKRAIGSHQLTFEQLTTLLVHVEGCLNSRPLLALTDDHTDYPALTASHFLIGEPIIAPLAMDYTYTPMNRLNHFRCLQKLGQEFWSRWSKEIVTSMMHRSKWYDKQPNMKVNDIVLIKSENTPPTKWPIGRITKTYPDHKGEVRIVDVLYNDTIVRRPIVKLVLLPIS